MPSGKTHDRITLWGLPWVGAGSYFLTRSAGLTLAVTGSYLFAGLMFGPDLDIYSVQYKRWGFLRWLWRPYQKCIGHRSWFSHGFLLGTSLRILYLSLFLGVIGAGLLTIAPLLGLETEEITPQLSAFWHQRSQYFREAIALFVGLELGAMSHSFSDGLISFYRKLTAKKPVARPKKREFGSRRSRFKD